MGHPIRHFITITTHRHAVFKMCCKCGIPWRGFLHDLSKYSPAEFIPGARYWSGKSSPQEGERTAEGFSQAWMHHKGRNKHHFEYWNDYVKGKGETPIEMPDIYIAEMFCDRVAACKVYQKENYRRESALEYFERALPHYRINPVTADKLGVFLKVLAEEGEDKACECVRKSLKKSK